MKGVCIILSSSRSGWVSGRYVGEERGGKLYVRLGIKKGGMRVYVRVEWGGLRSIGVGEPWEGERKPWSEKETTGSCEGAMHRLKRTTRHVERTMAPNRGNHAPC